MSRLLGIEISDNAKPRKELTPFERGKIIARHEDGQLTAELEHPNSTNRRLIFFPLLTEDYFQPPNSSSCPSQRPARLLHTSTPILLSALAAPLQHPVIVAKRYQKRDWKTHKVRCVSSMSNKAIVSRPFASSGRPTRL